MAGRPRSKPVPTLVNDVSAHPLAGGGRVTASGWVAMHRQGTPADMQHDPRYDDVVAEVRHPPARPCRTGRASAGVDEVWIDPGIGFGKTLEHNLSLLASLGELVALGVPGRGRHSRQVVPRSARLAGRTVPPPRRRAAAGSSPTSTWAMAGGVHMVRVHDVARHRPGGDPTCGAGRGTGDAGVGVVKGKWAAGILPRNFTWVIKDRLAMSERPGGFAPNHRRVRRQEEIIWLRVQGSTAVVSLLPSPHNLQAYEEQLVPGVHYPLRRTGTSEGGPRRPLPRAADLASAPASGSSCTKRSSATGSWGSWRVTCSGRDAFPAARRRSPCSST